MALQKEQIYDWDFDVFKFSQACQGRPLQPLVLELLEREGLLSDWRLRRATVERFLEAVQDKYRDNPYHNATHAADVTQTAGVIMRALDAFLRTPPSGSSNSSNSSSAAAGGAGGSSSGSGSSSSSSSTGPPAGPEGDGCRAGLSRLERFAIILAAAVHDLGHPGVNNAFLVKTRAPMALTYNDRSVNENMHACLAFSLAQQPGLNIFEGFSDAEYEQLRKYVVAMVLSTDMDVHFALLKQFGDALGAAPDVRTWTAPEQRSLLFQMLVHLADLANPSRPWHLALAWAERVVTEFLAQGRKEAEAGIPISPPCDASKVCMPAAQLFFIERFCAPTLEAFKAAAPGFHAMAAAWLADTAGRWALLQAAGVRLPGQDYPLLPPRTAAEEARLPIALPTPPHGGSGAPTRCCAHNPSEGAPPAAPALKASSVTPRQHSGAPVVAVASMPAVRAQTQPLAAM